MKNINNKRKLDRACLGIEKHGITDLLYTLKEVKQALALLSNKDIDVEILEVALNAVKKFNKS